MKRFSENMLLKKSHVFDKEKKEEKLNEIIEASGHIVFLGGAGVSTESGIPDFRSKDGLYRKKDKKFAKYSPEYLLSAQCLSREPEIFFSYFRKNLDVRKVQPNAAHRTLARMERGADGSVPSSTYLAVRRSDDRLVGIIDLRHHIDHPILGTWGGHIGYSVHPDERRKGYATRMLQLDLENARKLGIQRVMVTCDDGNTASEKTILKNGGVYEKDVLVDGRVVKRFWIEL